MIPTNFLYDTDIQLTDELINELLITASTAKFYVSKGGFWRYDITGELQDRLQSIFSFTFCSCGFLKTMPGQTYNWHRDNTRISAINVLLTNPDPLMVTSFLTDNYKKLDVDYRQNVITLFNVQELHTVTNTSVDTERIILSIGFTKKTYDQVLQEFLSNNLIKSCYIKN
jgi:hypothetical protein